MHLIDLDALIKKADELPALPASITQLITMINSGISDVQELTRVIRLDPMLTLRLLRMANSAFSGASVAITTVEEAVARLGTARVLSLAIASHARPIMRVELTAYHLREGELWRHSVLSMLAAEALPKSCRAQISPAAFTAALLHDIGKLVMARFLSPEILELLDQAAQQGGLSMLDAEAQVLQVHHGELGGLIGQHWNLPENVVKGITYHHDPENGFDILCDVVHLADLIAKHVEARLADTTTDLAVSEEVVERLGFDTKRFSGLVDETLAAFQKIGRLYGTS